MRFSKRLVALWFGLLWLGLVTISYAQTLTLTTEMPFYPFAVPTEDELASDPLAKAYQDAVNEWLTQNPDVTLEQVDFDIWERDVVIPALAGGTAPSFFSANEVGGYTPGPRMAGAVTQNLLADVTAAVEKYGLEDKMSPVAKATFDQFKVDGKSYALPQAYFAGNGVYYRKDWIKEVGLEEPTAGWTWDDFLTLAKALTTEEHKGAVVILSDITTELTFGDFGWETPKLEGNWRWRTDYTSKSDKWTAVLEKWHTALYEDKTLLYDPSYDDVQTFDAFIQGEVAMQISNTAHFTDLTESWGLTPAADALGKSVDEVFGWVELPRSELDNVSATQPFLALTGLSPDLDAEAVDKAVSLVDYMQFGEGYVKQKQVTWETTQDLRAVYDQPLAVNGVTEIPGVDGSIADAWGQTFIDNVNAASDNALPPARSAFLPPEEQGGPGDAALQDALNVIINSPELVDVAAELKKAEDITNQQAESFTSSIPVDEFKTKAHDYFVAVGEFYQSNSPEFYTQIWKPWYDTNAASVLGGLE
jgi:maltose-binding protein MalE